MGLDFQECRRQFGLRERLANDVEIITGTRHKISREPGGHQNGDARPPAPYLGGKFIATHSARHEDIGKQQSYARITLHRGYGLRASACRASGVSKSFGELGGEFAQFIVVLHDQNLGVADTIRSDHFHGLQNDGVAHSIQGRYSRTVVPFPTSLVMAICPSD